MSKIFTRDEFGGCARCTVLANSPRARTAWQLSGGKRPFTEYIEIVHLNSLLGEFPHDIDAPLPVKLSEPEQETGTG